jgi:hypothetical protein
MERCRLKNCEREESLEKKIQHPGREGCGLILGHHVSMGNETLFR